MAYFHPSLTLEKWHSLPASKQILNIASELTRAQHALEAHNIDNMHKSLERTLELIDLTVVDSKWRRKLRELLRLREHLGGFYIDMYTSIDELHCALKLLVQFDKESARVLV